MEVYTSRWANRDLADLACVPVGISRGVPRFALPYQYRRVSELAPDDQAWAEQDPEAFRLSYLRQLGEIGADAILGRLERVSGGLPVVCLCYEDVHAGESCHRRYLADFLRARAGLVVPELEGHLPRRPDAPQQSLFDGSYREERTLVRRTDTGRAWRSTPEFRATRRPAASNPSSGS